MPLKVMPVVRCTTTFTVTDARLPVFASVSRFSLYQGGLPPTAAVTVTPPLPVPLTVRLIDVVRGVWPVAVPVIVTGNVPVVAFAAAVKVAVLLLAVAGFGLNVTVTPAGWPVAASVTAPANPPVRATPIVLVPAAPPCVRLNVAGVADSV